MASSSADSERVCSAESVLSSAEIGRATVARGASPSEAAPLYAGWPSSLMSMPRSSKSERHVRIDQMRKQSQAIGCQRAEGLRHEAEVAHSLRERSSEAIMRQSPAEMRRWPCALRTRKTRLPRSAAQLHASDRVGACCEPRRGAAEGEAFGGERGARDNAAGGKEGCEEELSCE